MLSLFKLRSTEPDLHRRFVAPMYPWFPGFALAIAAFALGAITWFNPTIAVVFVGFLLAGYVYFRMTGSQREHAPPDPLLEAR